MKKKRSQPEADAQKLFFKTLEFYYPTIRQLTFAIPNGGYRTPLEAFCLKKEGVSSGVPDIFCAFASGNYHGLFIEMKRPIVVGKPKGAISASQKIMIDNLLFQGYCVKICHGAQEALETILSYWNLDTN